GRRARCVAARGGVRYHPHRARCVTRAGDLITASELSNVRAFDRAAARPHVWSVGTGVLAGAAAPEIRIGFEVLAPRVPSQACAGLAKVGGRRTCLSRAKTASSTPSPRCRTWP